MTQSDIGGVIIKIVLWMITVGTIGLFSVGGVFLSIGIARNIPELSAAAPLITVWFMLVGVVTALSLSNTDGIVVFPENKKKGGS